jgi:hypothetical protein
MGRCFIIRNMLTVINKLTLRNGAEFIGLLRCVYLWVSNAKLERCTEMLLTFHTEVPKYVSAICSETIAGPSVKNNKKSALLLQGGPNLFFPRAKKSFFHCTQGPRNPSGIISGKQ